MKTRRTRKIRRVLTRLIPYKGKCFWGIQVGPLVFQYKRKACTHDHRLTWFKCFMFIDYGWWN